ncbi:STAS/SEC14 domain-containing protein [Rhabdochromatium marinum]|uniref:STAS/SEC14 domain-containing protein n=1 Tax=Rhabdochromatium marinum TaxID=48729 RepID=UPI001908A305|nr:STAS/SEC14 domain-containing protein [Rhabdochromatium marinum]MBK1650516.1 STAS/SEC14 domain-containing protein [Rhabdochromatium marinum]
MIEIREQQNSNIVEMAVSGSITAQEFDDTLTIFKCAIEHHGRIRLLEDIGQLDTPPIPWTKLWDDVKFSFEHLSDITHVAVVADQGWIGVYVNMLNPLMKAEIKHFKRPELKVARIWLSEAT